MPEGSSTEQWHHDSPWYTGISKFGVVLKRPCNSEAATRGKKTAKSPQNRRQFRSAYTQGYEAYDWSTKRVITSVERYNLNFDRLALQRKTSWKTCLALVHEIQHIMQEQAKNPGAAKKRLSLGHTFLASYGVIHFSPWQQVGTIKAAIGAFFLTIAGV